MNNLLQKYIIGGCTPEEMEEVVRFFQESKDTDIEFIPRGEEVLRLLEKKTRLKEDAANRIFQNIISHSPRNKKIHPRKTTLKFMAAALITGLIFGGWFLGQLQENDQFSAPPAEGFVTLELENGQKTLLGNSDSLQLSDTEGNIFGFQKGTSIVYSPKEKITSLQYNTITVPYGKRFELSLSDGTRVYLNAGTSFKFPVAFVNGETREVFLSGEAFFDVSRDEAHPFIVNTEKLDIEVLGTEFNVTAYKDTNTEQVVLLEGKVKVKNEKGDGLIMAPDQMVSTNGDWLKKSAVIASDYASWKDGYFTLKDASTAETIALLERYYHIEIRSEDQQDPEKIVGSGKVALSEKVENVITTLSLLTNNTYSFKYSQEP